MEMIKFGSGDSIVYVCVKNIQAIWIHPPELAPEGCLFQIVTPDGCINVTESERTADQLLELMKGYK